MMTLTHGRPAETEISGADEKSAYDFLDALQIPYDRVAHEAAENMEDCVAIDKVLGVIMCKNLFLCNRQKTNFYLLLMPADKPFKTKDFSALLGIARVSFGSPEDMGEMLHVFPGCASVLGLLHDTEKRVQLVIDRSILKDQYIGCHPLVNTASLRIATKDIMEKFLPKTGHTPILVTLP